MIASYMGGGPVRNYSSGSCLHLHTVKAMRNATVACKSCLMAFPAGRLAVNTISSHHSAAVFGKPLFAHSWNLLCPGYFLCQAAVSPCEMPKVVSG